MSDETYTTTFPDKSPGGETEWKCPHCEDWHRYISRGARGLMCPSCRGGLNGVEVERRPIPRDEDGYTIDPGDPEYPNE